MGYKAGRAPFSLNACLQDLTLFRGSFWRTLDYYSSQGFFLLLLVHLGVELGKNEMNYQRGAWIRLCATLPCGLLLLFTRLCPQGECHRRGRRRHCRTQSQALHRPLT